jgi:alkylation response protein AidB-like acyl-CoA dehydrogenase
MDFEWREEQRTLREAVVEFASQELNQSLVENDRNGVFNHAGWNKCGHFGLQGLTVPAEYGGMGKDSLTAIGTLERLGYACKDNGLIFSLNAHLWTVCMPLVAFGSEAQKQKYLPGLCKGEFIGANAMSEPSSGSDAYSLGTTAEWHQDGYVLNGHKIFVTNGPIADVFVVYASVDKSKGQHGLAAFLVEKGMPGLSIGPKVEKMGLRTALMSEVFLDNCKVSKEHRLGAEGKGSTIFNYSMTWERGCILAHVVGSMQRLLETCIAYARERRQFGQPIGKFQLVASRIVDMKLRVETARHVLYHSAWLRSLGQSAFMEVAITKLYLSECWVRCCEDAIQIHGGYGYMTGFEVERELRDAIGSKLYSGTSEVQRNIIAGMLGL